MVLRVTAQLCRENCTYLAGESVQCKVLLENIPTIGVNENVAVAWCSAQIICRSSVNDALIKLPKRNEKRLESEGSTSFYPSDTEKGQTVLTLTPKILCCDVHLSNGDRRELMFSEPLPFDVPASYSGRAVRYYYKLVIGVQPVHGSTKLLRIAFRVFVVPGLNEVSIEQYEQALDNSSVKQSEGAPSNPFLRNTSEVEEEQHVDAITATSMNNHQTQKNSLSRRVGSEPNFSRLEALETGIEPSRLELDPDPHVPNAKRNSVSTGKASRLFAADLRSELVLACASNVLGELAGATSPHQFTVATRGGRVCRLYLQKLAFRLGESVVAAFDFAACDVRTHRIAVHLESDECIDQRFAVQRSSSAPGSFVTCHVSSQQTVACLRTATCELEVPSDAPSELCNELVTVRWRIRFEFHVLTDSAAPTVSTESYTSQWKAPRKVQTQATEWTLPIRVFPCSPLHSNVRAMCKPVAQLTVSASRPESGVDVV